MIIHRRGAEDAEKKMKELTAKIIGAAIEVHKTLGPGLLESAYEECLAHEMQLCGLDFERQVPLPVAYKGINLNCGYRLDFLVEKAVVLELKAVDALQPIHEAQLLTYLKLGCWTVGLLINFNVPVLRNGIKRIVLNYEENSANSAPLR
jgi:GxxExxY protein